MIMLYFISVLFVCHGKAECGKNGQLYGGGCVCVGGMPWKHPDWLPGTAKIIDPLLSVLKSFKTARVIKIFSISC